MRVWKRADGQSVEDAMIQNEPCEFTLKDEPLGESVAIRDDSAGFLTTSDGQTNAPIYFYEDLWFHIHKQICAGFHFQSF